ncbi:2,3,4,5-tetrahydropyridine-2,6-carboxylate N-succinyltransferase [Proteus vulgaris]|nr:2,3,4,5-tetrahydropyridine-2,6-carboxylate N-succinyltransferase [Proteus vulgaris]
MQALQSIIDNAFEHRADITPNNVEPHIRDAINNVIEQLDSGKLRVAEKIDGQWGDPSMVKKSGSTLFSY